MRITPENGGKGHFDFPKIWLRTRVISGAAVIISLLALIIGGLSLGIDFEGGTSGEVQTEASIDEVTDALPAGVAAEAVIQEVTEADGTRLVRVRSSLEEAGPVEELRNSLATFGEITSFESVGPTWGSAITDKALRALVFFFIAIAMYISVRLEWRMAVGALIAVTHDIIISVGVYALFRFEVTPATVIAFLTIMGYSLYDTIVVYDKVRDITARVGATGRYTYTEMMNLALNQVLARSVNTTISSLLPVVSMLVIGAWILGAGTLAEFSIALMVGLIVGGYSSLFIASYIVALLKEREPEYVEVAAKVAKRTGKADGTRMVAADDATFGEQASRARARAGAAATKGGGGPAKPTKTAKGTGATTTASGTTVPPRPRKTKKKK